jgi:hypothetical protein
MLLARITVTLYGVIMHASSRCFHWMLSLIAQVNCGANQHHVDTAFPKGSLNEEACVKYPLGWCNCSTCQTKMNSNHASRQEPRTNSKDLETLHLDKSLARTISCYCLLWWRTLWSSSNHSSSFNPAAFCSEWDDIWIKGSLVL